MSPPFPKFNSIGPLFFFFIFSLNANVWAVSSGKRTDQYWYKSPNRSAQKKKHTPTFFFLLTRLFFFLYLTPWGLLETTPVTRTKKKCINFISSSMTWGGYLRCVDASRKVKMVDSSWITKKERRKGIRLRGGIIHGRCGVALPAAYIANRNLECSEILELYFSLERRGCAGSNEKTWRQQKQLNIFVFAATDVIIALLVYERRGMWTSLS